MLYLFAFLSGVVMIFAPCVWPLLPIILSAGAQSGRRRPVGIVVGLAASFLFVTLALAQLLRVVSFDPSILHTVGALMIIVMGLVLLVPSLGRSLEGVVSLAVGRFGGAPKNREGFWGGCLMGAALGIVWSPCAGPILATVAAVAATSGVNQTIFWMAIAFVLGVSLPLFGVALLGQRIFARLRQANRLTQTVQRVFGIVVIGMGILMYTGYDVTLQTRFVAVCQKTGSWLVGFEQNKAVQQSLEALRKNGQE